MNRFPRQSIGSLCLIEKGSTGIASSTPGEFPLVTTAMERKTANSFQFDTSAVCIPLVSSTGHGKKTLNYVHYQEGKFALGTILAAIIPRNPKQVSAAFLHRYLQFFKDRLIVPLMKGAANVSLAVKDIAKIEIPVPPFEEQANFVELFNRATFHYKEIQHEFHKQADLLKTLRQTILQEAIEGKLTAKWREAHPMRRGDPEYDAAALLEQIKIEKQKLIAEGKIKKEKPLPPIKSDEMPFKVPKGWLWCRIISASQQHVDCPHATPQYLSEGIICLRAPNIVPSGLNLAERRFVSKPEYLKRIERLKPQKHDLVFIREGGRLGIAGILDSDIDCCLGQRLMLLRFFDEATAKFTSCFLNSPTTYKSFIDLTIGAASPHVNVRDVVKHPIPFPPLAEQHAIVERVDRLLSLVSELETQVSDRKAKSDDLMQAVLREAFEGKTNQPRIHTDEHR